MAEWCDWRLLKAEQHCTKYSVLRKWKGVEQNQKNITDLFICHVYNDVRNFSKEIYALCIVTMAETSDSVTVWSFLAIGRLRFVDLEACSISLSILVDMGSEKYCV